MQAQLGRAERLMPVVVFLFLGLAGQSLASPLMKGIEGSCARHEWPLPLPVQIHHFKAITWYCAMSSGALAAEFPVGC